MRKDRVLIVIGGLVSIAISANLLFARDKVNVKELRLSIPDYSTSSRQEADTAADSFVTSLRNASPALWTQLERNNAMPQGKLYPIYLLGELRDPRSAPLLLKNIDFKAPWVDPRRRIGRWSEYPARDALVKLGRHAVREILAKAAKETDRLRSNLMASVVWDAEGEKLGRILIQDRIAQETDSGKRDNLIKLLAEFDAIKRNIEGPDKRVTVVPTEQEK